MFKNLLPVVVLAALAGTCRADVKISGETKAEPYRLLRLKADGDVSGAALIWDVSDEASLDVAEVGTGLILTGRPGTYTVKLRAIRVKDGATSVETARATVTIAEPTPPPGPKPPEPTPQPEPQPPPAPAPIKEPGLHVLVVYESADLAKYPLPVHEILRGKAVRDFLNQKCAKDADGKTMAYRFYDQNADARADQKYWQEALKRPRKGTPWLVVSNPSKGGYEGELPKTPQEFIDLVSKYAD